MKKVITIIFSVLLSYLGYGQNLTIGEIYDFNVGDEYHYTNLKGVEPPSGYRSVILDRYDSPNKDTVIYKIEKTIYSSYATSGPNGMYLVYNIKKRTDNEIIFNLDSNINTSSSWVFNDPSLDLYKIMVERKELLCDSLVNGFQSEMTTPLGSLISRQIYWGKGLGVVYNSYYDGTASTPGWQHLYELIYFKKNGIECGTVDTTYWLGIIEKAVPTENIKVFPNPSNGVFQIAMDKPITGKILVYNPLGSVILERNVSPSKNIEIELPVSCERGLYTLKFISERGIFTERITIQ